MTHQYSIEQLPKQLEHIIQEVEKGGSAQITRQGERVAVILSATEYDRLRHEKMGFGQALEQFRQEYNVVEADINPDEIFLDIRDNSLLRKLTF